MPTQWMPNSNVLIPKRRLQHQDLLGHLGGRAEQKTVVHQLLEIGV